MSRAEDIVAAIETRLKTIKIGSTVSVKGRSYTYRTDLGRKVFMRRMNPMSESERYMLNIVPGVPQVQTDRAEFGLDRYRLGVGLLIMARGGAKTAGKEAADVVSQGVTDITQAVRSDRRWGGLARWSEIEAVGPDAELQKELAAQKVYAIELLLNIEYTTNSGEV